MRIKTTNNDCVHVNDGNGSSAEPFDASRCLSFTTTFPHTSCTSPSVTKDTQSVLAMDFQPEHAGSESVWTQNRENEKAEPRAVKPASFQTPAPGGDVDTLTAKPFGTRSPASEHNSSLTTNLPIRMLRHRRRFAIGEHGQRSSEIETTQTDLDENNPGIDPVQTQPSLPIPCASQKRDQLEPATEAVDHSSDIANARLLAKGRKPPRSSKVRYPPSSWKSYHTIAPSPPVIAEKVSSTSLNPGQERTDSIRANRRPGVEEDCTVAPAVVDITKAKGATQARTAPPSVSPPSHTPSTTETIHSRKSSQRTSPSYTILENSPVSSDSKANPASHTQPLFIKPRRHTIAMSSTVTVATTVTSIPDTTNHILRLSDPSAPTQKIDLPDPEIAYAQKYYFTTCSHTSPPRSRPLNVQPTSVEYRDGLLTHPPVHLRVSQSKGPRSLLRIYILEGSCSVCDLLARREAESQVLDRYADRLDDLLLELAILQKDIEGESSIDKSTASSDTTNFATSASSTVSLSSEPSRSTSTSIITLEAIQTILVIEAQLDTVIHKRDGEVKAIWKGYTERWGPATVGIYGWNMGIKGDARSTSNGPDASGPTEKPEKVSSSASNSQNVLGMTSTWTSTASALTDATTSSSALPQRSSPPRKTSTSSRNGPRERYSDGTHPVNVDSSVDGVQRDGRMMVDWIRPGPGHRRSRSQG